VREAGFVLDMRDRVVSLGFAMSISAPQRASHACALR
jgi:hypothetical protein